VWFIGFTPDLVVGVYMGYDKPRHLGRSATGGHLSAPIAKDFFKAALADKAAMPFPPPRGIKLIRVDAKTGQRAGPGTTSIIQEAFKPGTAPPENNMLDAMGGAATVGVSPEADGAVRRGGLY
jgi:penicillin-binding protein 1A